MRNVVLISHGTGSAERNSHGLNFADGPGQPLDAWRYYIILLTGGLGPMGKPPSRAVGSSRFPHYGYKNMVEGQCRLPVESLGVASRLVMETSMGGVQARVRGERHPTRSWSGIPSTSKKSK